MSEYSAPSISSRPAPSCAPPSPRGPRSRPPCRHCWWDETKRAPTRGAPTALSSGGLPHVAALAVFQRVVAEVDPVRRREEADRDRLAVLQRHQDGVPIVGALAMREGDALDLEPLAEERLERLL